jgi:tetratricopeptide (TPR) repeat protein
MAKYAAALPGDPNPEDSYAEILRLAGRFEQSIQHYRAALAIDPKFYSSQFGIADTYSLMGKQTQAREEYKIGFEKFPLEEMQQVLWKTREATTYVREGDVKGADRAFQALADTAHARHISQVEADTYRQMAIYQSDAKRALQLLGKADAALLEHANATQTAIQQESAQILRARVELAVRVGDKKAAQASLEPLDQMAQTANDRLIEAAYHGAAAAIFYSEGNYDRAIEHLEEDTDNPLSVELLADAYQKNGDLESARRTAESLSERNDPTVEQALVVPNFRKCYQDPGCDNKLKNASFPQ